MKLLWGVCGAVVAGAVLASEATHWSYDGETGPDHWTELEEGSACSGLNQSPVNIIVTDTQPDTHRNWPLSIHYPSQTRIHAATNNGHSIQYDFDQGDEIEYRGQRYALKQVHFHEPSEHTINGVRYPIEMHLVHVNQDIGQYTVLALMGFEGSPSPTYQKIEQFLPMQPGQTIAIDKSLDLSQIFNRELMPRFHYAGSLTTPPCSENVNWVVFERPFMLSHDQVVALKNAMPINNYRNEQPLHDRIVSWVVN